jgi:hypothetical protein
LPCIHREPVAVGASDPDEVADLHIVQGGCDPARPEDAELQIVLDERGRGDRDHRFPFAEDREHGALPAAVVEAGAVRELGAEGLDRPGADDLILGL